MGGKRTNRETGRSQVGIREGLSLYGLRNKREREEVTGHLPAFSSDNSGSYPDI